MAKSSERTIERCAICGCYVHRTRNTYALPTVEGRSHATRHHLVAERFFGRSTNRRDKRPPIFDICPWGIAGQHALFCYECHEELIHNPVLLPEDIVRFAGLCRRLGLDEEQKTDARGKIAGRIRLFHDATAVGIRSLCETGTSDDNGK
jgi:hypothetical protein